MSLSTGRLSKSAQGVSYQNVLDAPPHQVAELLDGELHVHPRPAPRHAVSSTELGSSLVPPFGRGRGGPGGWWILFEPELHFGEDVLVPDLAGWRKSRMPELPEEAYFTLRPDWVCEVLSPATRRVDTGPKRVIYAREGVTHLWFVDPNTRTLEAFELRNGLWVVLEILTGDAEVSVPPFDAISFDLSDLWPYPP